MCLTYTKPRSTPGVHLFHQTPRFCTAKKRTDSLFDLVTSKDLNGYLKEFHPDLSAKVFRTMNASCTLEKELAKFSWKSEGPGGQAPGNRSTGGSAASAEREKQQILIDFYSRANRTVAILCNHQKNVSSAYEKASRLKQQRLETLIEEDQFLKEYTAQLERAAGTQKSNSALGKKISQGNGSQKVKKGAGSLKSPAKGGNAQAVARVLSEWTKAFNTRANGSKGASTKATVAAGVGSGKAGAQSASPAKFGEILLKKLPTTVGQCQAKSAAIAKAREQLERAIHSTPILTFLNLE